MVCSCSMKFYMKLKSWDRNLPRKSQWWIRRFSNSGLFLRLYLITAFLTVSDVLPPTRLILRRLLFVLEPLLLLIFMLLERFVVFWPCALSVFGFADCIKFEFDRIGLSWLFWWLYGGGGVIRICVSCREKKVVRKMHINNYLIECDNKWCIVMNTARE